MSFTKTIGTRDPWCMPSDEGAASISKETKTWERREYHKARRREGRKEIKQGLEIVADNAA